MARVSGVGVGVVDPSAPPRRRAGPARGARPGGAFAAPGFVYDPARYWTDLVRPGSALASVGNGQLGEGYNRVAYRLRRAALRRALGANRVPTVGADVFEAGFGVGFYLELWGALGAATVTGVDIAPGAVGGCRRRFPGYDLFEHDIRRPVPRDRTFDIVTAIDVLYHVVDDAEWSAALGHLAALVRPGGVLMLTDKFPTRRVHQRFGHVRRRPLSMYREALDELGLAVASVSPVFVLMDDALPPPDGRPAWLAGIAHHQFRAVSRLLRLAARRPSVQDALGLVIASAQLPLELALLGSLARSPNLELLVARRRAPAR